MKLDSVEVEISRLRVFERIVIAVRKNSERERTSAARDANMSVERHIGVREWPRSAGAEIRKSRNVDAARDKGRTRRVVDRVLG